MVAELPYYARCSQEMLDRREAGRSIISFAEYTYRKYRAAAHHRRLAAALEAVERGELTRIIVDMPPRHGKSELASVRFPAWYLGRNPDRQVINAAYAADLAYDFSRKVRNIIDDQLYSNVFKHVRLADDSQNVARWGTSHGGAYVAAGVGGPIVGRGAHLAIIDDPFKNREEADSETIRQKVWDWYVSTLYTRLEDVNAIVIIMTRWHEDDLVGRLLDEQSKGGDKWHVISMPAIENEYTDNERALWPEKYPLERLHQIRSVLIRKSPREWYAQYQQSPHGEEGTFFQKGWFKRFKPGAQPKSLHMYISSDFAVSDGKGDFTELAAWGVDDAGDLWAMDWWYGQTSSDVWIEKTIDMVSKWKPFAFFGEAGVIQRAVEPQLIRRMREREEFFRCEYLTSSTDKPSRARGFQARAAMGTVHVPYTDWGERLVEQLVKFPGGKDDAVDACSLIANAIDQTHPAIVPSKDEKKKKSSWEEAFRRARNEGDGADSWKVK